MKSIKDNKNEKDNNISRLKDVANDLKEDFVEARKLRESKSFDSKDKEYFMTRCKQAEGIISASKNILENLKELDKPIPEVK